MAAYSHKEVCYRPGIQNYVDQFEQKYGREFDGDSNYDGDYWLVADDYISDLVKQRDELVKAAEEALEVLEDQDTDNNNPSIKRIIANLSTALEKVES